MGAELRNAEVFHPQVGRWTGQTPKRNGQTKSPIVTVGLGLIADGQARKQYEEFSMISFEIRRQGR
jgi:hypothetical protein